MKKLVSVLLIFSVSASAEETDSMAEQCEMLRMYGVFIRYHPAEKKYDWVDDFIEVADGKALFVASRNGKMIVGWGGFETTPHDYIYRDSINVVNGEVFFVSMDDGKNYLNLGQGAVASGGTACNIRLEPEANNTLITWELCGLGDHTRFSWNVPKTATLISAYPE